MRHLFLIGHFIICFLMTLWKWDYAIVLAITIELTQIDVTFWANYVKSKSLWWNVRIFMQDYYWGDTILDVITDAMGILAGILI